MHDERLEELIGRYIAGELSPGERATVEEHLRACEECRLVVETGLSLEETWSRLTAPEPTLAVWPQIVARLRFHRVPLLRRVAQVLTSVLRPQAVTVGALAAAALLLVGAAVYVAVRNRASESPRWTELLRDDSSRMQFERTEAPQLPSSELPDIFGAAHAVLRQVEDTETSDTYVALKSRIVAQQLAETGVDASVSRRFRNLLADVEIALAELAAAERDPDPMQRIRQVRKFIDEKDLLTRLAVARARIQALSRRQNLPPEVVQAYLRPPM